MNPIPKQTLDSPEVSYAMLRVSLELFQRPPASLDDAQYQQMLQQVNRELAIAQRVLTSKEALDVVIPEGVVSQSLQELAQRYESEEAFNQALEASNLDQVSLTQALKHDLRVEAVLEKVLARKAAVSDEEVEIYYYQHLDRFELPETRTARHILITINEELAENDREEAQKRIAEISSTLQENPNSFYSLAERHSECPTAMHEGLLGRIKPGQLYPELDGELFQMGEGELSDVIESPIGLHLLLCETIHPAERLSFEQVKEKLREHLESKKRKRLLQEWLQQKG